MPILLVVDDARTLAALIAQHPELATEEIDIHGTVSYMYDSTGYQYEPPDGFAFVMYSVRNKNRNLIGRVATMRKSDIQVYEAKS